MSKYHVIVSNSDGEQMSHLNLSLVGMLDIAFARWSSSSDLSSKKDLSAEELLDDLYEYWGNLPVVCTDPGDHILQVFISNKDELHHYNMDRLFESKKALLKWAKSQIRKSVSEEAKE